LQTLFQMKYKLVRLKQISGCQSSIYSMLLMDEQKTLFERFLEENKNTFKSELKSITNRLNTIGHFTGARESFFKLREGKPGDGVCALFDTPNSKLRLYCLFYVRYLQI
jgi:hypothetical protein